MAAFAVPFFLDVGRGGLYSTKPYITGRLRCETCGRRNQRLLVGYDQAAVPDV